MFVLDTDILTLLFAGHSRVLSRREQVSSADIATTVVSRIQSLLGRFQFLLKAASGEELLRAQSLLDGTMRALAQIETVLGVDVSAAAEFDRLRQHKKLKKIGRGDLLIAALTLANRGMLVTRNVKDFRQVPGFADRKLGRLTHGLSFTSPNRVPRRPLACRRDTRLSH